MTERYAQCQSLAEQIVEMFHPSEYAVGMVMLRRAAYLMQRELNSGKRKGRRPQSEEDERA